MYLVQIEDDGLKDAGRFEEEWQALKKALDSSIDKKAIVINDETGEVVVTFAACNKGSR